MDNKEEIMNTEPIKKLERSFDAACTDCEPTKEDCFIFFNRKKVYCDVYRRIKEENIANMLKDTGCDY